MSDDEREETDSECERLRYTRSLNSGYEVLAVPECENLTSDTVASTMRRQAGLCRLTGMAPRPMHSMPRGGATRAHEIDTNNHIIVLSVVKEMREATGLSWRPFVQLIQLLARDIEL